MTGGSPPKPPSANPPLAEKPKTLDGYIQWARSAMKIDFEDKTVATMYNVNLAAIHDAVRASPFYEGLVQRFDAAAAEYVGLHEEDLFMSGSPQALTLFKKPFKSTVEKTFRKNVLWNRNFPAEPDGGWVSPRNWFTRLDDVLRTSIVCRFLDGPEHVARALETFTKELGIRLRIETRGLDEGYYAHHCYVSIPADYLVDGAPIQSNVEVELQITTQLQDVLRTLTHRYYAEDRIAGSRQEWKWQFKTNRFRARFLAHSLHLLEALIVDVRDKKSEQ